MNSWKVYQKRLASSMNLHTAVILTYYLLLDKLTFTWKYIYNKYTFDCFTGVINKS